MHNPHLDKLNLIDRLLFFVLWSLIAGFGLFSISTLIIFPVENINFLIFFTLTFSLTCGMVGAIWPRRIKQFMKKLLDL